MSWKLHLTHAPNVPDQLPEESHLSMFWYAGYKRVELALQMYSTSVPLKKPAASKKLSLL